MPYGTGNRIPGNVPGRKDTEMLFGRKHADRNGREKKTDAAETEPKSGETQGEAQGENTAASGKKFPEEEHGPSAERIKRRKAAAHAAAAKECFAEFLACFAVFSLIFSLVLMNAEVPSESMNPRLTAGDRLIASRLAYAGGKTPARGDIVIFPAPDDTKTLYIKRVVALPGETAEMKNGILYIDGKELKEDYVVNAHTGNYGPFTVPAGCVFCMGDNRDNSWDGRFWTNHFVQISEIRGKALFRYAPLNRISVFVSPDYD